MWFVIVLETLCLFGDFLVKKAVIDPSNKIQYLLSSFIIYGSSAFGWYYIMKQYSFITSNMLHALFTVLIGIILGVFVFKEKININEGIGITFGVISLYFLTRK